jgi:DNA replication protein DnaC
METLQRKTTELGLERMEVSKLLPQLQDAPAVSGADAVAAEIARVQEETANAFRQRRADDLLKRAAIPPRFADRRLETFIPHAEGPRGALRIATEYADNFDDALKTGRSLILCGGVGAGKTHLAVGIAHRVIAQNRVAVFTSVLAAIRTVKETYGNASQLTEAQAIERLTKPDLLILDEVGVQFGSATEKMIMFEIINGRYEALRPTIVISNLAKDALIEYLGERAVDRLREGGGRMVIFDWPSFRKGSA